MIRRVAPQPDVDWMVSPSWNGRRLSSPAARQGRALAPGLDGRLPFQHLHANDRDSWRSRCPQYFPLALKHGICRGSERSCSSPPAVFFVNSLEGRLLARCQDRTAPVANQAPTKIMFPRRFLLGGEDFPRGTPPVPKPDAIARRNNESIPGDAMGFDESIRHVPSVGDLAIVIAAEHGKKLDETRARCTSQVRHQESPLAALTERDGRACCQTWPGGLFPGVSHLLRNDNPETPPLIRGGVFHESVISGRGLRGKRRCWRGRRESCRRP
jgi:hypothetical protein